MLFKDVKVLNILVCLCFFLLLLIWYGNKYYFVFVLIEFSKFVLFYFDNNWSVRCFGWEILG